ncbi:flagellar biosynthesis protein FlhB [Hippea maritima]|uniref:Flagellar biosynthetic protein FlhB n=1 Tax=Hippea maritima (strain ATCC 700847 / DSM 10411 / MH2) TaxID=760142 RepID=F2LVR0_HIPMA|nr:flagellar biosynthesis protein FlhB [Hippea maritima]AEA33844.1 flagellar biosynthetic protein FlhB [Hippea maritima DSM 10411]
MPDEDKTEQATPKRRQEAREEGRVAKSVELNTAFLMLAAVVFFYFTASNFGEKIKDVLIYFFTLASNFEITLDSFDILVKRISGFMFSILLPFFIVMATIAFLINVVQVGFYITPKAMEIKFDKINPVNGFKNMFSLRSFGELVKSLLKASVMGYILWIFIQKNINSWSSLSKTNQTAVFLVMIKSMFLVVVYILIFIIFMAILDYLFQKYTFEKSIMMTKQEVKDEYKQMEGDPKIKQKIRSMQMEMTRKRMMEEVKKADVVITNPTHYAVALKYDSATMAAPKVVAKGINLIAKKIKEIAKENDVPIVEKPELARSLYEKVKLDREIPEELYQAVAEILAYVFKLKNHPAS